MAKNTSNPFKKAAEKQKKAPGGEVRVQAPVVEAAPAVEPTPALAVETPAPAATAPVVTAPVVETPAPAVEPAPAPAPVAEPVRKSEPVDMMSFYKEQVKIPKKDEKVRKQFVIPKSIDDKLKKAMKNKEIPSENQLINDLLKNFFDGKLLIRE